MAHEREPDARKPPPRQGPAPDRGTHEGPEIAAWSIAIGLARGCPLTLPYPLRLKVSSAVLLHLFGRFGASSVAHRHSAVIPRPVPNSKSELRWRLALFLIPVRRQVLTARVGGGFHFLEVEGAYRDPRTGMEHPAGRVQVLGLGDPGAGLRRMRVFRREVSF